MGNPFGAIWNGIKKVLGLLGHLLHFISTQFTEDQLNAAISYVKEAVDKFADNANRRTWVAAQLTAVFHLPDHLTNLLVEMAVTAVKNEADAAFQKVEDTVDAEYPPAPATTTTAPAPAPATAPDSNTAPPDTAPPPVESEPTSDLTPTSGVTPLDDAPDALHEPVV